MKWYIAKVAGICSSIYLSVCLSVCLPVYLLFCVFVFLSLSVCLSVCLSVRPSVRPSVRLSICLSIRPSDEIKRSWSKFVCTRKSTVLILPFQRSSLLKVTFFCSELKKSSHKWLSSPPTLFHDRRKNRHIRNEDCWKPWRLYNKKHLLCT
jgi:hypothetical protein